MEDSESMAVAVPLRVQAVWKRLLFFAGDGRVGLDDGFCAFEALLDWCGACGPEIATLSGDLGAA